MENQQVLNYKYVKGERQVFPAHKTVSNWLFTEETEDHAVLCNAMAVVAEKNGVSVNELQHISPAVLRMLKVNSQWTK